MADIEAKVAERVERVKAEMERKLLIEYVRRWTNGEMTPMI